jgi:predicted glycosyltransferase
MRFLFDIVHPADVHFFKHAIAGLSQRNHEVLITSRDKDIALSLLEEMRLEHVVLTTQGSGPLGLLKELARRDIAMLRLAKSFKPDVLIANNSPCVAHVGAVIGRPSIIFDDTEINKYNRLLYRPSVTEIHSPDSYRLDLGCRQTRFPGLHALAYLHPDHFCADHDVLRSYGLDHRDPYFLFRFVKWGAIHDVGVQGLTPAQMEELVRLAGRYGRVVISSETDVPDSLRQYRLSGRSGDVHHIIAHATGVIGESATMCSEAASLGCQSILIDRFGRGYTDKLEQDYKLCTRINPNDWERVREAVLELCRGDIPPSEIASRHRRLIRESTNVSKYQLDQLARFTGSASKLARAVEEPD